MISASASAQSVNLFEEVDAAQGQFMKSELGEWHRHVKINREQAEAVFNGDSLALSLDMEFEPGKTITFLTTDRDAEMAPQTKYWSGRAQGTEDGSATILYRRGGIVAHFQVGAETYRISPQRNGIHMITRIDQSALPREGEDMVYEDEGDDMIQED